jgi:hypothetical protein
MRVNDWGLAGEVIVERDRNGNGSAGRRHDDRAWAVGHRRNDGGELDRVVGVVLDQAAGQGLVTRPNAQGKEDWQQKEKPVNQSIRSHDDIPRACVAVGKAKFVPKQDYKRKQSVATTGRMKARR